MSDTTTLPSSPDEPRRTRVALIFGGRSGEHGISVVTAAGIMRAIDRTKYDVVPIGITARGQWVLMPDVEQLGRIVDGVLPEALASNDAEARLSLTVGNRALRNYEPGHVPVELGDVDVVFPVLHGPFGEDGTLQGLLEMADARYVGCGVLASAVGMDKHFMKLVLEGHGIPTAPYIVVKARDFERDPSAVMAAVEPLGLPLFVKPARGGSSLGVTRIDSLDALPAALAVAQEQDPKVLVEAAVAGREIECAVLGGRDGGVSRASLPGEICVEGSGHDFYDFEAKYISGDAARLTCPADLTPELTQAVRAVAVRTFDAMECEGLARVDVFVTPDGKVIVNEINTMPGFTPISMFPRMWAETGIAYPDLIDELIQLALERPTGLR